MSINPISPLLQAKIQAIPQKPAENIQQPTTTNQQEVYSSEAANALVSQAQATISLNTDQTKITNEVLKKAGEIQQSAKEKFTEVKRLIDLAKDTDNGTIKDGDNTLTCSKDSYIKTIKISGKHNATISIFDSIVYNISYEEKNDNGISTEYSFSPDGRLDSCYIGKKETSNTNGNQYEYTRTYDESFAFENNKIAIYRKNIEEKGKDISLDKATNKEESYRDETSGLYIKFDENEKTVKYQENAYLKSHTQSEENYD